MDKLPNIVPVTDFRKDAAKVLNELRDSQQPTVVTQRGRAAAIMLSVPTYERTQDELAMLRALFQGEEDLSRGDLHSAEDVFAEASLLLAENEE